MAIQHASPTEVIDLSPLGDDVHQTPTTTLIKTDSLEVIRLVLPAGKAIKPHHVAGEITVQCLEGRVAFHAEESNIELTTGTMIYLAGSTVHSLKAVEDSTVLVTILLPR